MWQGIVSDSISIIPEQIYSMSEFVRTISDGLFREMSHYTEEEKNNFINYIKQKTSKLTGDEQSLFNLFINMYSNPVKTKKMSTVSQ